MNEVPMKQVGERLWEVEPDNVALPRRPREAHKGDFGRCAILGGCVGYTGAPALAARAAVRMGAGLVTVLVPKSIWAVEAVKLDSAMPLPLPDTADGALSILALEPALERLTQADAALIGPGLSRGPEAAEVVRRLIGELTVPLVLDADGINALEGHIDSLDARQGRLTVLTPHDGEFARLTGMWPEREEKVRLEAARAFAADHDSVLVLKGHRTITAFPDGDAFINTTGNPGMAKGGAGDVLAGMTAALLAQGLPVKEAVPWAVCLHGQAGDLAAEELGEYGMSPEDMLHMLPRTTKRF